MMAVELGLGDADGGIEIVVGQGRVQDFVAVVREIGRIIDYWKPSKPGRSSRMRQQSAWIIRMWAPMK